MNAQLESRKKRMWDLVRREDNVVVLEQALGKQVAERVVFFVEGEDGRVGNACRIVRSITTRCREGVGSALTSLLFPFNLLLTLV